MIKPCFTFLFYHHIGQTTKIPALGYRLRTEAKGVTNVIAARLAICYAKGRKVREV